MVFHVAEYYQAAVNSTTFVAVNTVTDQVLTQNTAGNAYQVPSGLNYLAGAYGDGADLTGFQIQTPSLLQKLGFYHSIEPVDNTAAAVISTSIPFTDMFDHPLSLAVAENLQAAVTTSGSSTVWLTVFLESSPMGNKLANPVPANAQVETILATSSTTLTAHAWSLCTLTLAQQLQAGTYALVGMRAESAKCLAARVAFAGGGFRPGCIGANSVYGMDSGAPPGRFRYGNSGVWGYFNNQTIPQIEFFSSAADTSETVFLDVYQVAGTA